MMIAGPRDEVHSKDRTWFIRGSKGAWYVYVAGQPIVSLPDLRLVQFRTREAAREFIRDYKKDALFMRSLTHS